MSSTTKLYSGSPSSGEIVGVGTFIQHGHHPRISPCPHTPRLCGLCITAIPAFFDSSVPCALFLGSLPPSFLLSKSSHSSAATLRCCSVFCISLPSLVRLHSKRPKTIQPPPCVLPRSSMPAQRLMVFRDAVSLSIHCFLTQAWKFLPAS